MFRSIFIVLSLICSCWSFSQTTLSETILVNGQTRSYRIYIPAMYTGTEAVPVVFNFHGYGSNNSEQEAYGDFRPIADTANFILIHPQGLDIGGGAGWNNFTTVTSSNYDYLFIDQLIDTLNSNYNIDLNRVYSTGMSNGGFMSYDLACFMSYRFAAIASVAGSMIASHKNACNPQRKVPVMQVHGTSDQTVLYNGQGGSVASVHIDTLVEFWKEHNDATNLSLFSVLDAVSSDNCSAEHSILTYSPIRLKQWSSTK